tara:strand:- start:294 stop:470 length:177 start_codon:yes stop_codon:yes gene_type:complete
MQEKSKLEKLKQAEQELNKMIDFYRDMITKSHYHSGNQTIKDCEESLQYLVDNFNYKG